MISKSIIAWLGAGLLTVGLLPVASNAAAHRATANQQAVSAKHPSAQKQSLSAKSSPTKSHTKIAARAHAAPVRHTTKNLSHTKPARHKTLHATRRVARPQSHVRSLAKLSNPSRTPASKKHSAKALHATTRRPVTTKVRHTYYRPM